jgi:hypothetical protein
MSIKIGIFISDHFIEKNVTLDRSHLPIKTMILAWKSPQLFILLNCQSGGSVVFESELELSAMSLPFSKPNVILPGGNGIFFTNIKDALIYTSCVDDDFKFPNKVKQQNERVEETTRKVELTTESPLNKTTTTTIKRIKNVQNIPTETNLTEKGEKKSLIIDVIN